jgi:hypothetical protein
MAGALAISALALFPACACGQERVIDNPADGLAAWRSMESVLTHPRCLNCHTMTDYPRQGDERRVHGLKVKRGPDGRGEGPKCQACHTDANQTSTGIPGAKDWHVAPPAFAWESEPGKPASGEAICATLKRAEDGEQPDYERLIEYAQLASFVLWAWDPGKRMDGTERTTPLLTHEEFVQALKRWISAGSPCPGDAPASRASSAMAPAEAATPEAAIPETGSEPASPEAAPGEPAASEAAPAEVAPEPASPGDAPPQPAPAGG